MNEQDWQRLRDAARMTREHAHAPYSGFKVGAAVRSTDGRVFTGANVENASFGLTTCAERNAVAAAVAAGARSFVAAVVVTDADRPTAPCGACRQVLAEFGPAFDVRCYTLGEAQPLELTTDAALPHAFGPGDLQ